MTAVAVRRAGPQDMAAVRAVRLAALADTPDDFDSTLEHERAWEVPDWERFVARGATFLLDGDDGDPAGLVLGEPHRDDVTAVFLGAMWVEPSRRGTGAADALVGAVVAWATERGARAIHLHVQADNGRARRFYGRNGFRAVGDAVGRNGRPEIEMRRSVEQP